MIMLALALVANTLCIVILAHRVYLLEKKTPSYDMGYNRTAGYAVTSATISQKAERNFTKEKK